MINRIIKLGSIVANRIENNYVGEQI